jgi:hypothetical protein
MAWVGKRGAAEVLPAPGPPPTPHASRWVDRRTEKLVTESQLMRVLAPSKRDCNATSTPSRRGDRSNGNPSGSSSVGC